MSPRGHFCMVGYASIVSGVVTKASAAPGAAKHLTAGSPFGTTDANAEGNASAAQPAATIF